MYKYEKFIQDNLGKKKNDWTFVGHKQVRKLKAVIHLIMCQCKCGVIKEYTVNRCIGDYFPQCCKECSKKKFKNLANPWQLADQQKDYKDYDVADDERISDTYDTYYKRYFRDDS